MKRGIFIILLFILLFSSVLAQSPTPPFEEEVEKTQDFVKGITNATDNLANNETRVPYIEREWTKILGKTQIGQGVLWISENIFEPLNPVFLLFLRVEYSLSWIFFFSLLLFISILLLLTWVIWPFIENKFIAISIVIVVTLLIGITGAIKIFADFLGILIPNIWVAIIILLGFLVFFYFAGKQIKEEIKEEQEKQDKRDIHTYGEIARTHFKEINKR